MPQVIGLVARYSSGCQSGWRILIAQLPLRVVLVKRLYDNAQFPVAGKNAKGKEGVCDELLTAIDAKVAAMV
ncbi:MAG: hypothetical protein A3I66_02580 [Burkholderiales bacterium RIFCSPLOWO2_02_FULL_57_36]|nr:MAG: hypothetical protein A3I66_02580 [Burkholderiales bacterium RIFCSPLOWO2_02_FULL_57_36]